MQGLPTRHVMDIMDSISPYFGKGANNVLANPRPAVTPESALKAAQELNGVDYYLDTSLEDPLTYITRNELKKAREKRGY